MTWRAWLAALRHGLVPAHTLMALMPTIAGGSENTYKLYMTGFGGYDSSGRPFGKTWTVAGTPPANQPMASVNAWGGSKYTVYWEFNPGTGSPQGSYSAQIESAQAGGADGSIRWIPVGGAFTQTNQTASQIATMNGPLAKCRLNITSFTQSLNGDASLLVALVETHD